MCAHHTLPVSKSRVVMFFSFLFCFAFGIPMLPFYPQLTYCCFIVDSVRRRAYACSRLRRRCVVVGQMSFRSAWPWQGTYWCVVLWTIACKLCIYLGGVVVGQVSARQSACMHCLHCVCCAALYICVCAHLPVYCACSILSTCVVCVCVLCVCVCLRVTCACVFGHALSL